MKCKFSDLQGMIRVHFFVNKQIGVGISVLKVLEFLIQLAIIYFTSPKSCKIGTVHLFCQRKTFKTAVSP